MNALCRAEVKGPEEGKKGDIIIVNLLWLVVTAALLIWLMGLALSEDGWIWIFFIIALIAGGINIAILTGKKSGRRFGPRRYKR